MALPHFNLKDKNVDPSHIIMRYRYTKRHYLKYYTNHHITPKHFSTRSLVSRSSKSAAVINSFLENLRTIAMEVRTEMLLNGVVYSTEEFKSQIDIKLGIVNKSSTWYDHAYLIYNEKLRLKRGDTEKVKWWLSKINKVKTHIGDVTLDQLTKKYFKTIVNNELSSNNSPAYINKLIKIVKQVCKDAEEEHEVHQDYKFFKLLKATTKETIYNTLDEVEAIYYYDYSNFEHLRNTANAYIIGCFTSLRVSDFLKVARNPNEYIFNHNGIEVIKVNASQKTKTKTVIPLHPIIKDMINKYNIVDTTNKTLNENLKVIGQLIGMDQDFNRLEWKGGIERDVTYKRWQLLSTHCARRSFVSIMWGMGVPARTIMHFTGHKSEKQLMEYMKLTGEKNALEMADHEFFKLRPRLKKVN